VKDQLSAIFSLPPATDVDEKSLGLQLLSCNTALFRPLYGKFGAIVDGFSATTVNTSSPVRDLSGADISESSSTRFVPHADRALNQ
jgi:hypothetical protein